ncbi:MAG: OadG family protein [Phycisphaeraceae bacterium]
MTDLMFLAQTAAPDASYAARLQEGLSLMVVGMLVVFTALAVIGIVIGAMAAWFRRYQPMVEPVVEHAAAPAPIEQQTGIGEGMDDARLLAVLTAAAVTVMGGRRVQIRRMQLAQSTGWAGSGRAAIHSSHNLRRAGS